jgi:hypothetical protein
MRHAVFATSPEHFRSRVTRWLDLNAAHDEWERLNERRIAGELPHVKFVEVRSSDDPKYNALPFQPWDALPVEERPQWVKLDRPGRERLLAIGRRAGSFHDAADAMLSELLYDPQWSHLEAVTISDYAWAAAAFCFPREASTY